MTDRPEPDLNTALLDRFADAPTHAGPVPPLLLSMAARGSCRTFQDRAVPDDVIDTLCAVALASPTKSDLQQRDIILLRNPARRQAMADLVPGQSWVADAPHLAVFCGNNRRQRLLHDWRGVPFANDHLDAFFNAAGDAAIALGAFVTAAEAVGLGCCPISAVRNDAGAVSELLGLPQHVFPFAGLAFGYPQNPPSISKRLPLRTTVHVDSYTEGDLQHDVSGYDADRAATQPYAAQRFPERFGTAHPYTWSEDKMRQYSAAERSTFGAYVRAQGFALD